VHIVINFQSFDLNLLRVFDAAMSERSLTRAAKRLHLSQSAVSHALKRLREAVGEDQFERTAFGVIPTPRADALWPSVRTSLAQLQHAIAPAGYDPRAEAANFRLTMADATAAMLLPPIVQVIEGMQALANLQVLPLTTRDPRALIEHGDADLAVGYFPQAIAAILAQGGDAQLHHQRLYESEYRCVMRPGHPLADVELTLDRYCEAHHLFVSFSGRPHGPIDEALAVVGRRRRIVLTVNQFFTAGRVVMQSDLLTVLPASFIPATGFRESLVIRPLPIALANIHVEMVWHARRDDDPRQRWLREQVMAASRTWPA
jgi:DNA-binding transcriptional LysR family regulator